MIHLAPPAWTMTDSNAEPRHDELTALIGELCENELFDHCLREELHWLQGDILDLAQAAPDTIQGTINSDLAPLAPYRGVALPEAMELAPLNELAPAPDVLLQQQPGGAGQPQQAYISDDWQWRKSTKALPQARPGAASAQPQAIVWWSPSRPGAAAPQQAFVWDNKQALIWDPAISGRTTAPVSQQPAATAQPRQALLQK